jgi:hypothetical protein
LNLLNEGGQKRYNFFARLLKVDHETHHPDSLLQ